MKNLEIPKAMGWGVVCGMAVSMLLTLVLRGVVFGTLGQMPWATAAAVMAGAFAAAIMQSGKKKRRSGRR